MNIGFIGIGVMGEAMARNLMQKGHTLWIYTRTQRKAQALLAEGAHWCDSIADCAQGRDVIITMVGFPKDVEEVYFGAEGLLAHAQSGCYLIDMTTTRPDLAVRIAQQAQTCGLHAMDAPVSGGDVGARTGTLTIMVGGEQADFEAMRPVFACMGNQMHWMGGPGSGQHTKMANQIAIAGALAGVCEAVTYAKGAALDPGAVLDAIGGGAAGSWQLRYNGAKMIASDRSAGFYIKHYIKDLRIALEASQAFCGGLEVEPLVLSMFESLAAQGMDEDGTQSLIYHYLPMDDA